MKIGFAFDLKVPGSAPPPGVPDDLYEEYDPPATVDAIADALAAHGHQVVRLGGGRGFLEKVLSEPVDFVFTISEGRGTFRSREGQVPSVCEMLGIPYSFSDPLTLALSLDKPFTKRLVREAGVETAPDWTVRDGAELAALASRQDLPWPLFVKPAYEGSSKGIRQTSRVLDAASLRHTVTAMLDEYHQPVMVEGFVSGDEYTVGVVGNDAAAAVGAMRIRPKRGADPEFVYSIEMKRDWENQVAYDVPPPLPPEILSRLYADAVKAFRAIGARDVSRVDFRVRGTTPVFLEINPLPGLSPVYGDLPLLSKGMGISYEELMGRILSVSFARQGLA
jgi:D-alanine-D-alanine ligase